MKIYRTYNIQKIRIKVKGRMAECLEDMWLDSGVITKISEKVSETKAGRLTLFLKEIQTDRQEPVLRKQSSLPFQYRYYLRAHQKAPGQWLREQTITP